MTVYELIQWLGTQDQEAEVEIVHHTAGRGYHDQGGNARWEIFDPAVHAYHNKGKFRLKPYNYIQLGITND